MLKFGGSPCLLSGRKSLRRERAGDVPRTPRHEWTTSQRRKADQPGKDEPHPRVDREADHADGATLAAKTSRGHGASEKHSPREPNASAREEETVTDPEPDTDSGRATVRNMRSKCRCSCVLQFTFRRAVRCVLHRPPSQVIHCAAWSLRLRFVRSRGENRSKSNNRRSTNSTREGEEQREARSREGGGGRSSSGYGTRPTSPKTRSQGYRTSALPARRQPPLEREGRRGPPRRQALPEGRRRQTLRRADASSRRAEARLARKSLADREGQTGNDPSAGSPTETLLRLLLPLNAQVRESSRATTEARTSGGPVQIPH